MPHRSFTGDIATALLAWIVSTAWGSSILSAIGDNNSLLPSAVNPMQAIDATMAISTDMKLIIFYTGVLLWFGLTASLIFRYVAMGVKMMDEGRARVMHETNDICTFPDCRYEIAKERMRDE